MALSSLLSKAKASKPSQSAFFYVNSIEELSKILSQPNTRQPITIKMKPAKHIFSGETQIGIHIKNMNRVFIDAAGCDFIAHGRQSPLIIENSEDITFVGASFDWERPPFSQGKVESRSHDGIVIDVRVDEEFPIDGLEPIEAITTIDTMSKSLKKGGVDAYGTVLKVELADKQLYRLTLKRPLGLYLHDTVILRHHIYGTNVITVDACKNIKLKDLQIYAAPGMGIVGTSSENINIIHTRITPKPSTSRLMSTCADGVHLQNSRGLVVVTGCKFHGMGDDAVNVLSPYYRIEEIRDRYNIVVSGRNGSHPINPIDFISPGDKLTIANGKNMERRGERICASFQSGAKMSIRLDEEVPEGTVAGDIISDSTKNEHRVLIHDSDFGPNRARAILVHDNAHITNCRFFGQSASAILLDHGSWSLEGSAISNVSIINNKFFACGTFLERVPAIQASATVADSALPHRSNLPTINANILISDNQFHECPGGAIYVRNTTGLTIKGNRFETVGNPVVEIKFCNRVQFAENISDGFALAVIESAGMENQIEKENKGFKLSEKNSSEPPF